MKNQEIKFRGLSNNYSIIVGNKILGLLPGKIKSLCPKTKKIALIFDKKVPKKFINLFKKKLNKYEIKIFVFNANEKSKSLLTINFYLNKLLLLNFNRSDLIISIGGGITGDVVGFLASIFKRGINFINVPTTLLAQVDSAVGGKTGVNSQYGKNLVGSFYQPKLVISDTNFLRSLPYKEMVCGYAEILKHSIIKDKKFFNWLSSNTKNILSKKNSQLIYAIKKSCMIKMHFVSKDEKEKGLRMKLNFGHTFAHAIEAKNYFSKKISHGEAVLAGMILAIRLSLIKKTCNSRVAKNIEKIYEQNNLRYTYKKYSNPKTIINLIPFLKHDKKNNDNKINFILLKNIGKTTQPNAYKISVDELKRLGKIISEY